MNYTLKLAPLAIAAAVALAACGKKEEPVKAEAAKAPAPVAAGSWSWGWCAGRAGTASDSRWPRNTARPCAGTRSSGCCARRSASSDRRCFDCDLVVIPRVLPGKLRLADLRQELVQLLARLQSEPPALRREPRPRGSRP